MNPFGGGQLGSSGVDVDGVDPHPNEISSSSGGVGVKVDCGERIIFPVGGMDRATVSSMLQELKAELEEKFEKRMTEEMAKEREARKEREEVFEDCIEKLMEELCQVALIVTGKREDEDDDPSRQRENITKRLGIMFREVKVKLGKWKRNDTRWETREEMYLGIKRELGLENSEGVVQDESVNVPSPQMVSGQSFEVPNALSVSSTSRGQEEEKKEANGSDQPSGVRSVSGLGGDLDARLGPPYLRLRRLDPAVLVVKNARDEEAIVAPRDSRATNAIAIRHLIRSQPGGSMPGVGGRRQDEKSRRALRDPDPQPENKQNLMCSTFSHTGNFSWHSNSSNRPFECPRCPARFKFKSNLTRHISIHSDRKPFKCQVCGAGFKRNDHLTTHLRVHTGERPFACETCGKTFTDSSDLKKHRRTHLGEKGKIYKCPFCSMKFVTSSSCHRHQRCRHKSELESEAVA